jgi:uncharacterized membrane protein
MLNWQLYNDGDLLWLGDWSLPWLIALAILGALVIGISAYDLRSMPERRRWTLVALRGAVYALAVGLLLEPAIDLKHVTKVKNDVAVLVDTSRTMNLKTVEGATRFERVGEALEAFKSTVEDRGDEHEFHFYGYDGELHSSSRGALTGAAADGNASNLTGALKKVAEEFESKDLGGVVVISDGIDTGAIGQRVAPGESLDEATRRLLKSLEAPVNTVAAATDDGIKDVAIAEVRHDDFAFVHNKVSIEVTVQVVGMGDTSFPVQLRRRGELLQTRTLEVTPDKRRYDLSFEFVPEEIGKEIYSVSAPEFSGEALLTNNLSHFLQNVIRDKIRVLQVVGQPSWDERFLRRFLKENSNVDLISFFILRTSSNVNLVPPDELSLIPFPTRELFEQELGSFDLVIFQNFNFGPYNVARYLPEIAKYVKDGGGFAMIGGDKSFASGGYANTPIEDILPVELPSSRQPSAVINLENFRPELTDAGRRHPITQLAFDPEANRKIWNSLPKLRGTNVVAGAKPGATVLAEHPTLRRGGGKMPVLTISNAGEGRVMALTSDSTWRWGFENVGQGGTPREYSVFWNSAIRWLIKDPELKLIQVDIPEENYAPGSTLAANIRLSRPDYRPARDVEGRLEMTYRPFEALENRNEAGDAAAEPTMRGRAGAKREASEIQRTFKTDHEGRYKASLPVDASGIYRVTARADTEAGQLEDSDITLSTADVEELRQIVPRDDLLKEMARATQGTFSVLPDFDPSDLPFDASERVEINRRKVIHLWDSVVVFGIILVLLGLEWTLRRQWGRL